MLLGIDTLDIVRMQKFIENERFLNKYFTDYEAQYCNQTVNKTMRLAGIFCAKEAFLKALGIGLNNNIALNEIEVRHDERGKPYFKLYGSASTFIRLKGFTEIQLSISHTHTSSYAVVIIN